MTACCNCGVTCVCGAITSRLMPSDALPFGNSDDDLYEPIAPSKKHLLMRIEYILDWLDDFRITGFMTESQCSIMAKVDYVVSSAIKEHGVEGYESVDTEDRDALFTYVTEQVWRTSAKEYTDHLLTVEIDSIPLEERSSIFTSRNCGTVMRSTIPFFGDPVVLPCSHRSDKDNLMNWLETNGKCPYCRKKLLPDRWAWGEGPEKMRLFA